MSLSSCEATMIDISKLPKYSKIEAQDIQNRKKDLRNIMKLCFVLMAVAGLGAGRYLSDKAFDSKTNQEHRDLDSLSLQLFQMKQKAALDNNYKNPTFRKEYIRLDDELKALKAAHKDRQTNGKWNILKKHHGRCDECDRFHKMGVDGYFRE